MLVGREPAKMRPSKDLTTCGRVCAVRPGSSSVMAGCPPGSVPHSGGSASGCPGLLPGTPGDPARRAGSQGAAEQETLPLIERNVHARGAGATGATSRGPRPVERGATGVPGSMMPAGPLPPECHAARLWKRPPRGTGRPRSAGGQERELADLPVAVHLDDMYL